MSSENRPLELQRRCCVVGGDPAGMMQGLLLARAGVAVAVLEKHGDFLRDLRGGTVHSSTLPARRFGFGIRRERVRTQLRAPV